MTKIVSFFAAALTSAVLATPIAADAANTGEFAQDQSVEYADLDLTTKAGVEALNTRITSTVRRVCDTGQRDLASIKFEQECRAEMLASVEPQVRLAVANANSDRVRLASEDAAASDQNPGA